MHSIRDIDPLALRYGRVDRTASLPTKVPIRGTPGRMWRRGQKMTKMKS
jgi:hypothetical protein